MATAMALRHDPVNHSWHVIHYKLGHEGHVTLPTLGYEGGRVEEGGKASGRTLVTVFQSYPLGDCHVRCISPGFSIILWISKEFYGFGWIWMDLDVSGWIWMDLN